MRVNDDTIFSYPVLRPKDNPHSGYTDSDFDPEITPDHKDNITKLILENINLKQNDIKNLLEDDKCTFGVNIKCPLTHFNETIEFDQDKKIEIAEYALAKNVIITPLIWAKSDIKGFSSSNFKSVYNSKKSFDIDKSRFLAIGNSISFNVNNSPGSANLFKFEKNDDEHDMSFNFDGDHITIYLSKENLEILNDCEDDPAKKTFVRKIIMFNAFVTAIDKIRDKEYDEHQWYYRLVNFLESKDVNIYSEGLVAEDEGDDLADVEMINDIVHEILKEDEDEVSAFTSAMQCLSSMELKND